MRPLSLRGRATAVATVLSALVLAAGGTLLVLSLDAHLTAAGDELAHTRASDLLDQARAGALPAVLRNVDDNSVAQVLAADGTVLAASPNIAGRGPLVPPGSESGRRTIRGPDDAETETYRVRVLTGAAAGGPVTVVEGSSTESVREATTTVRRTLYAGVPLATLALGLVMWLVLGRALARLDRIRADVDAIGPDQLDRRVLADGRRDEVGRLAATMNRMLARVDASVQRQRRLVDDVSHDLRAPLAAQRVALELALAAPAVDVALLRSDVLGATAEMERLVDDLLVLAAAGAAEGTAATASPLDLDAVVLEEAARARGAASVVVDTSGVSAGPVRADPDQLRRVVRNLLDNAVGHAATRVEVRVAAVEEVVVLDVVDDGPGVPEADRERVFDRFHRGDPARTRGRAGTGLGLPIARSLAEQAGGTVELVEPDGPDGPGPTAAGAHFRLTLPLLSAAQPSSPSPCAEGPELDTRSPHAALAPESPTR